MGFIRLPSAFRELCLLSPSSARLPKALDAAPGICRGPRGESQPLLASAIARCSSPGPRPCPSSFFVGMSRPSQVRPRSPIFPGYPRKRGWPLSPSVLLPKAGGLLTTKFQFESQNVNRSRFPCTLVTSFKALCRPTSWLARGCARAMGSFSLTCWPVGTSLSRKEPPPLSPSCP